MMLFSIVLLGCQKEVTPENLPPDQQEIHALMGEWTKAWNNKNMKQMRQVYTSDSPEIPWLEKHMKGSKLRVSTKINEVVVFGDNALAKILIYGGWRDNVIASFVKEDNSWKLAIKTSVK